MIGEAVVIWGGLSHLSILPSPGSQLLMKSQSVPLRAALLSRAFSFTSRVG